MRQYVVRARAGVGTLTDAHDHQEARQEAAKVEEAAAAILVNKVVGIGAVRADGVGQRRNHKGCHNQQGEVVAKEGRREDDEEEADGEDLWASVGVAVDGRAAHEGEGDDCFETGGHIGQRWWSRAGQRW